MSQQHNGQWNGFIGEDQSAAYTYDNTLPVKQSPAILKKRIGVKSESRTGTTRSTKKQLPAAAFDNSPLPQSYNVYEIGVSDPNKLLPREFKPHMSTLPGEVAKTTY